MEYEIVRETFNACAGENYRESCTITEAELDDPMAYVKEQYALEPGMTYTASDKDGSTVVDAFYPSGIHHRYTFTPF